MLMIFGLAKREQGHFTRKPRLLARGRIPGVANEALTHVFVCVRRSEDRLDEAEFQRLEKRLDYGCSQTCGCVPARSCAKARNRGLAVVAHGDIVKNI